MKRASPCPTADELQRLTTGLISEAEAEPLEEHLAVCGRCVETLHGQKPSDTLSDVLRGSDVVLGQMGGEEVRGVVQRLEALAPCGGPSPVFDKWLSRKEGKMYELPSEAEWEYACRAGTATRFWCGDSDADLQGTAHIADGSMKTVFKNLITAAWDDGYPFTSPVGKFCANPWGLYDMGGNVWQWCADVYDKDCYRRSPKQDPKYDSTATSRVLRGGSWRDLPAQVRAASRASGWLHGRSVEWGFRLVMRPDAAPPMGPPEDQPDQFTPTEQMDMTWVWYNGGQYAEAERAATRAIELDATSANAYCVRSACRTNLGRYDEAVADADTAVRLAPMSAFGLDVRAYAYYHLGKWDKALEDGHQALLLNPPTTDGAEEPRRNLRR